MLLSSTDFWPTQVYHEMLFVLIGQLKTWELQLHYFDIYPFGLNFPLGIPQNDQRLAWVNQNLGFVGIDWIQSVDLSL